MKMKTLKIIGGAALAVFILAASAQIWVSAQDVVKTETQEKEDFWREGRGARALEGSWNVSATIRNCATGAEIRTFQAMNTFMQGGTMQEFSTGNAPAPRGPGHGVWKHEGGNTFSYAFQLFRFNADGTYAGITKTRREVTMLNLSDSYSATATIEIFNASGTLVGTACATETATRFE